MIVTTATTDDDDDDDDDDTSLGLLQFLPIIDTMRTKTCDHCLRVERNAFFRI